MQRFGAFYMDYLYTMESSSGKGIVEFSPPQSLFGHLATSPLSLFLSTRHVHSSSLFPMSVFFILSLLSSPCQTSPRRERERVGLVSLMATWSLTPSVLTLTLNLPVGQLSKVFRLH